VEFKIGKWHAGQWGDGQQILKVIWKKESSDEITELISELESKLIKPRNDII
jgi:hypothetical protein